MRFKTLLLASVSCFIALVPASSAADETGAYVIDSIQINASPQVVWEALKKHRLVTPGRKLVSYQNGSAVVSEQFDNLPIIGDANVTYVEEERPMRLDYHLIRSDKIKQFEGSYTLSPSDGGKHTILELRTRTDTGLHIPFSAMITKNSSRKRSVQRLSEIKKLAEATPAASAL